jgi:hypothetical protein
VRALTHLVPAQNLVAASKPFFATVIPNAAGSMTHFPARNEVPMFLIVALVLFLAWIGGFVVFQTAGFLIHLLLLFAVISIIFHFLRGRSTMA